MMNIGKKIPLGIGRETANAVNINCTGEQINIHIIITHVYDLLRYTCTARTCVYVRSNVFECIRQVFWQCHAGLGWNPAGDCYSRPQEVSTYN